MKLFSGRSGVSRRERKAVDSKKSDQEKAEEGCSDEEL